MLKLFGTASIEASGGPVPGRAAQGRRLALLASLALARGRPITRDKLTALLWPESPTDRARLQDCVELRALAHCQAESARFDLHRSDRG